MANQGPNFGLHRDCKLKMHAKFDPEAARTAIRWMESVLGRRLGDKDTGQLNTERDVADVLRDGVALCEVMNHINPGAIKKFHKKPSAFQQMENAELFVKACVAYGMLPIDTFHVKELYEARAVYTVVNCIFALGSLAQRQGYTGPRLGVKLAEKNERHFDAETLQRGKMATPRQVSGPSQRAVASQAHMTPYGLPRQIVQAKTAASDVDTSSHSFIGLQYGSNQVASQSGMTAYGMPRQISASVGSEGDANIPATPGSPLSPMSPTGPVVVDHGLRLDIEQPQLLQQQQQAQPDPSANGEVDAREAWRNKAILTSKIPRRLPTSPSAASSTVIGLQYGSNRGSSQAGMTGFGTPRQIVASTSSLTSQTSQASGEDAEGPDVFQ